MTITTTQEAVAEIAAKLSSHKHMSQGDGFSALLKTGTDAADMLQALSVERDRFAITIVSLREQVDAIAAHRDEISADRDELLASQHYRYIGKDGKTVLARDLEDERDALSAEVTRLRETISELETLIDGGGQ
jgi:hypothetical protein